jgi:hypothetical protein
MEKKKLKKLVLKKQTISSLDDNYLSKLKGGESAPVFSGDYKHVTIFKTQMQFVLRTHAQLVIIVQNRMQAKFGMKMLHAIPMTWKFVGSLGIVDDKVYFESFIHFILIRIKNLL